MDQKHEIFTVFQKKKSLGNKPTHDSLVIENLSY